MIKPDGRLAIQSGIGNLGTRVGVRRASGRGDELGVPWRNAILPGGREEFAVELHRSGQTTHAMTRAAYAVAMDAKKKLQEIAAKSLGGRAEDYKVAGERVSGNGRSMTLAQAAQKAIELGGVYDGHELPKDINAFTTASATALAGQGLLAVARDNAPRDGQTHSYVASFAEVEVDVETGKYHIVDFVAVADVGIVSSPQPQRAILGRSTLGMANALSKNVYDQHYGVLLARASSESRPRFRRD